MDALKLETRSRRYLVRKATERFAQIGMVLCTAVTVFFLLTILGYVIYHVASAIDWEFLTALPLPAGETGGGIANALGGIVGSRWPKVAHDPRGGFAGLIPSVVDGRSSRRIYGPGRGDPDGSYRFRQSLLEPESQYAHRGCALAHLHLCNGPV